LPLSANFSTTKQPTSKNANNKARVIQEEDDEIEKEVDEQIYEQIPEEELRELEKFAKEIQLDDEDVDEETRLTIQSVMDGTYDVEVKKRRKYIPTPSLRALFKKKYPKSSLFPSMLTKPTARAEIWKSTITNTPEQESPKDFETLGISPEFTTILKNKYNAIIPTPIQAMSIPLLLKGRDAFVSAETGISSCNSHLICI
jgi:hypothetical protein